MKKKRKVLFFALFFFFLIIAIEFVFLHNSRGFFWIVLEGQIECTPKLQNKKISLEGSKDSYSVIVKGDFSRPIANVDARYISFALDISQVVGGKWWNPKADKAEQGSGTHTSPIFDFSCHELDILVKELAPAYLRIGGSEADKVYYDLQEKTTTPIPSGYHSALTKKQWDSLHSFIKRNSLGLIFTLNAGPGNRNSDGTWLPDNSEALLKYSVQCSYIIDVLEFGNELNVFWYVHGRKHQVSVEQYAKDILAVKSLAKKHYPNVRLAVQGSAFWPVLGEPLSFFYGFTRESIKQCGPNLDLFLWHYYPQQSRRGPMATRRACPGRLLSSYNLDEAAYWALEIGNMVNQYAPGKEIWLGETGNAQFGGEPGLSDVYLASLWWMDQSGLLAKSGNKVVIRQTLSGMDYGMIEEGTWMPRPDYWCSLLWKRLMGNTVYHAHSSSSQCRVYVHDHPKQKQARSFLCINLDHQRNAIASFPEFLSCEYEIFALNSKDIFGKEILLNGQKLDKNCLESLKKPQGKKKCSFWNTRNRTSSSFFCVYSL
ncbi:MAG: hypothetical protein HUU50_15210 [Candidatus Brocadiae bacterium]|nr:hypothetical protein [Candidatus Brocadiia bacterium]